MTLVERLIAKEKDSLVGWLAEVKEQNGQLQQQIDTNNAIIADWEKELAELESL